MSPARRTSTSRSRLGAGLLALAALVLAIGPGLAGGPLIKWRSGEPFLWPDGGRDIAFHPDQGGLGPLGHAEAVALAADAFGRWGAIPTASATYVNGGLLPADVDVSNFIPYLAPFAPDGRSAIVFDESGEIFDLLMGPGSGVLGFAGPEWVDISDGTIVEGVAFLNGRFIDNPLPADEYFGVLVHEFGHFNNLSHTVVNGQIALFVDATGPSPHDTFAPENLFDRIETMYPFKFIGGGEATPHKDDIAIFSTLYPTPGFTDATGSIRGLILAPDGVTRLTGVNVIARNVADPFDDAVSAISSDFTNDYSQGNPLAGAYSINGLTPGATYAVYVDEILAGGFSTPPLTPLPGREEFYSGAAESDDSDTDDPAGFAGVTAAAGAPVTGADIVFNRLKPLEPLFVGDDGFAQIFLPFPFEFCGRRYGSLYMNANGSVTFGSPSAEFRERIPNHLDGPPRIAGYWDDLDPSGQGLVTWDLDRNSVTMSWLDVPEQGETAGNSFHVSLERASNRFRLRWDGISAADGLAGYSCGGRVTTGLEESVDLSVLGRRGAIDSGSSPALFERWTTAGNPTDVDVGQVEFTATPALRDRNEPNNILARATLIQPPYNSGRTLGSSAQHGFTSLEPDGADVDYYAFRAEAGSTLFAEITMGRIDSLLGLFDTSGRLMALDDDGGVGLLSRLSQPLGAGGLYKLAVTTYPDADFSGNGGPGGRYILDLRVEDGIILDLGDDDSVQVPLPFAFPFQGGTWTTVWVNSNGNLTFGVGDTDFSPSVAELLDGPPRIAGLWTDLSPDRGGAMTVESTSTSVTVRYENVPEFFSGLGNSFAITLGADGSVALSYGTTSGNASIVALTEGGGAADPGETDLSGALELSAIGTTYERFDVGEFDLDDRVLSFPGLQALSGSR